MCNLNQVFGGMQRYHYSCCRRKMHHIVAAPCCCGRDRTVPESSELCCPLRCSRMAGSSKIPAGVKTFAGSKSSSPKIQDPLRKITQRRESNKSSNGSVQSQRMGLQTNFRLTGSTGNSVKTQRKAGGSAEVQKSKGPCICTICEEDALLSGCSSNCDCDSTNTIFPTKSKRKSQGIKPRNSKSEPRNADLKALVRAKPTRKKIVARKYPTRSTECPVERPPQESNDDDGVWFECNLPFRVNIPFPISMQSLFGLQPLRAKCDTQISQSRAFVPARKLTQNGKFGSPFCLTMRNALPAPVPEPEPQPSTSKAATYLPKKKGLRRGKKRSFPCEISTQTGEEECDPVLCCLKQIRNQLAGKATEGHEKNTPCRCFAEKSTNVTTLQTQKKAKEVSKKGTAKTSEEKPEKIKFEPPEIAEELSAASLESSSSKSSQNKVVKPPPEIKKTTKKPMKAKSITSTTSLKKSSSKSSQNKGRKPFTKPKKAEKTPGKTKSISSTSSVQKSSSKSTQQEETRSQEKLQKKEERDQAEKHTKSRIDPEGKKKLNSEAANRNKSSKPRNIVEEKKSKKPEWIDPEPVRGPSVCFCGRPQVFPEYHSAMMQVSEYQPSYMYSWHNPMCQQPLYPDHCHQQTWQSWQTLEPEMPIYSSTESNKSASFNRNCTQENNSQQFSKSSSSSDQEPKSQPQTCQRSIIKRVSEECDQGVRDNRSVNSKPSNKSISFRGCACHYVNNSVDKSKISDRTRNTNDGSSCFEKRHYNSPEEICQEDSNSNNSYDEQENKDESSERLNLRREFPPSRENSRDRKYKAEETSQSQKKDRESKKQSIDSLRRSSADSNVQKNHIRKRKSSPKSETLSRETENPRSYGRKNKSKQLKPFDRISSGGEFEEFDSITRVRKCSYDDQLYNESGTSPRKHSPVELPSPSQGVDQVCSLNTEIRPGSGLPSKNKISQECYFSLSDKTPRPIKSIHLQEKSGIKAYKKASLRNETKDPTCSQSIRSNSERSLSNQISLSQDKVINTDEYQSNSSKGSDKKAPNTCGSCDSSRKLSGEPKIRDTISYNQKNSRDGKSEDQFKRGQYSRENQRKSSNLSESIRAEQKVSDTESQTALQKVPNGTKMDEEMASQNSENPLTKARSSTGSIKTEDIYESPSTSCKSSEIFDSRLIYSQFKRPSSEKRCNLNKVSENRENISQDYMEKNSREIPNLDTRPVSGMDMQANKSQYLPQAENWQRSPTIFTNGILVNKKKRSQSAPPCLVLQYGENRPERAFLHRRSISPRNQIPREYRTLPQSTENVLVIQDESCSSEMDHIFSTERIRKQYELESYRMAQFPLQKGGKDISVRLSEGRTPDYSINYSITQGNQQVKEESCFIPRQVQERTPMPRYVPEYKLQGSSRARQNPPMVLVPFRMESREVVNVCQPDEWRELRLNLSMVSPNQLQMTPEFGGHLQPGRSQPRKLPTRENFSAGYHSSSQYCQNTLKSPYVRNFHNKNILRTRPESNTSYRQSEKAYFPAYHHPFSRPNQPEENNRNVDQRRTTLASRQRRPSYTSVSQSEEGYVSHSRSKPHVERMEPKASKNSHKLSIASVSSSPRSSATRSSKSVQSKATGNPSRVSSRSISFNHQAKEKRDKYAGNRNKAARKLGGNSQISICRSDCRCYIDGKTLPSNSENQTSICRSDCRCYIKTLPTNSGYQTSEFSGLISKDTAASFQSDKTTDVETLETVTLLHPRRLRSKESTRVRTQDRDTENIVLLEIRTTCKKDNLLQTCGRPPCNFSRQYYTGSPSIEVPVHSRNYQRPSSRVPQNGNPFEENYLMRTVKPPTSMPAPGYQQRTMLVVDPNQAGRRQYHHFPIPNPGYYPEPVREKIKALPEGFYDQTINKYNIIRMDSDFQPPPLGPEIIQVIKAQPQLYCGRTGCPVQRQIMPQNQFHPRLPNQLPPFCPQPNVKLDGYDQSESQF